jgi:hypothetical protein
MYASASSLIRTQSFADIALKNLVTRPWEKFCLSCIGANPDCNASVLSHTYNDGAEVFLYADDDLSFAGIRSADRQKIRFDICAGTPGKAEAILQSARHKIGEHTANHKNMVRGDVPQQQATQIRDKARAMGARLAVADMILSSPIDPETTVNTINYVLEGPIFTSGADRNDRISFTHPHQDGSQTYLSVFRHGKDNAFGFAECFLDSDKTALSLSLLMPGTHALEILGRVGLSFPSSRACVTTIGREPVATTPHHPATGRPVPAGHMGGAYTPVPS